GIDLDRFVRQFGPLPARTACAAVGQAALGLQYLHDHGLAHRHIKPDNLMLAAGPTRAGGPNKRTVKARDPGPARWQGAPRLPGDMMLPGAVTGTPDYLAPEQASDASVADIRSDLYCLGGTLFYLLTGRTPFAHHAATLAKLNAHAYEQAPDLRAWRPEA